MNRRSLFSLLSAIPFVGLLAPKASAAEPGTALGMFERVTVHNFKDAIFEKPQDSVAFCVGEGGQNIICILTSRVVIVPMGPWSHVPEGQTVNMKTITERLTATLEDVIDYLTGRSNWSPAKPEVQYVTEMGDADRYYKTEYGTLVSKGPAGYILTDAKDPNRVGIVVFTHNLKILA